MFDYHMHSHFSPDASMAMEDAIKTSISKGLTEICFTDHLDYDYDGQGNDISFDWPSYLEHINKLQQKYSGQIVIKKGVEFGLQPHILDKYEKDVSNLDLDFIIASIHSVEKHDLYEGNYFDDKDQSKAYLNYFQSLYDMLHHYEQYSVLGHLDVIKRYGHYDILLPFEAFEEVTRAILKLVIEKGRGIELNTSGIRYQLGDYHPSLDILKVYRELGGEIITLGSDSHTQNQIAFDFPNALKALESIGFKYISSFDKMKPSFHRIDHLL
ncbi:histidinol-phosphatase HisJ family protein [Alkaliphilus metalliredigens]|nr:histidinol-phosphatase HisJ family protein [Alkaliphilus metalliredigens]